MALADSTRPEQIVASNVTAIAAGFSHSLFITNGGALWAMGANGSGQLGDGFNEIFTNRPNRFYPAALLRLLQDTSIACLLRTAARCGPWAITIMASWATARSPLLPRLGPTAPS